MAAFATGGDGEGGSTRSGRGIGIAGLRGLGDQVAEDESEQVSGLVGGADGPRLHLGQHRPLRPGVDLVEGGHHEPHPVSGPDPIVGLGNEGDIGVVGQAPIEGEGVHVEVVAVLDEGVGGAGAHLRRILLSGTVRATGRVAVVRFDKSTADKGRQYVRDRRSSRGGTGGRARPGGKGVAVGGGLGAIVIALLAALLGLGGGGGGGGSGFGIDAAGFDQQAGAIDDSGPVDTVDPDADTVEFMQALMFDIQDTWDVYFDQAGLNYQPTTLNIFTDFVQTGCGNASSNAGPFYCPAPGDMSVYIDLAFYDDLSRNFGAPGDFAQAYVIAHEIGHHLQSILGISDAVRRAQAQDPANRNGYSVRQELQADCFAGVWAHSAASRLTRDTGQPILERGDIAEGLAAAAAVGDGPHPVAGRARRRPPHLHPRLLGSAGPLVHDRVRQWRPRAVRHLRRRGPLVRNQPASGNPSPST